MRPLLFTLIVGLALVLGWVLSRGGPEDEPLLPPSADAVLASGPAAVLADTPTGTGRSDVGPAVERGAVEPTEPDPDEDPPVEIIEEEVDYPPDAELLARLGLPPDAPCALALERWGPPDPLEEGDATLALKLVDRDSGQPFFSEVLLWRLGAPANAYWTEGDQDVARAMVHEEGHDFEGLPAGEYRALVLEERARAPHQPAFFVSGRTEVTLFVERPGERPVRLVLAGRKPPLPRVEAAFHPVSTQPSGLVPYWVDRRDKQPPFDLFVDMEITDGEPSFPYDLEWLPLLATPEGLDLGTFREDVRCRWYHQRVDLRCDEGWGATVKLQNAPFGEVLTLTLDPSGD